MSSWHQCSARKSLGGMKATEGLLGDYETLRKTSYEDRSRGTQLLPPSQALVPSLKSFLFKRRKWCLIAFKGPLGHKLYVTIIQEASVLSNWI